MSLYAQALRSLGVLAVLRASEPVRRVQPIRATARAPARLHDHRPGARSISWLKQAAQPSAWREMLACGMAMFDDRGFYKRAQILASDLALAGVAEFSDLDRLTIFADNLVPHVLRCDGVLVYDERLAAHIDRGERLALGGAEREIRACALHACELISQRTGVPARKIDTWLWTRGQSGGRGLSTSRARATVAAPCSIERLGVENGWFPKT